MFRTDGIREQSMIRTYENPVFHCNPLIVFKKKENE
jgi:hypothetical protein